MRRESPPAYHAGELFSRLTAFDRHGTHRATHYELTVGLDPEAGRISVAGTIELSPISPTGSSPSGEARFLLHPGLELEATPGRSAEGPLETPAGEGFVRSISLPRRASVLTVSYGGRLPEAWLSSRGTELAFYSLWFPLFDGRLSPFTFRVRVRVPPTVIPVMSGRLVPRPLGEVREPHDDDGPRTYTFESLAAGGDIVLCAGPFHVHERRHSDLLAEAYVDTPDYDLGERYVDLVGEAGRVLTTWFGPLAAVLGRPGPHRLAVVIPPGSNWGGYSRPGLIVAPREISEGLRRPERAAAVEGFLAHEMGHLWFGTGVRSDTLAEPWLSEAFAEFARLVYLEAAHGPDRYRRVIAEYEARVASVSDPLPMRLVTASHPEMDVLVRKRGALMLTDLRETLGDPAMARLLSDFAARHGSRQVVARDFLSAVEAADTAGGADAAAATPGRDPRSIVRSYLDEPPGS